ncbi:MAG: class I SAM-dependent methyltransferase [Lachnospiraceae bacterium]|nr:class I SAM-dependent methyltransferase [Lachnospiraceae bacterium]
MTNQVVISKRLQAVAALVSQKSRVCDVGCDHGYVPIYLVEQGISKRVIAMDVNKGPLMRAKENILQYQMQEYIELRLSDGLKALQEGEADTVICAGMGGKLVLRILLEGMEKVLGMQELVLQPQSDIFLVRAFMRFAGMQIVEENMILEDEKYYPMMRVQVIEPGKLQRTAEQFRINGCMHQKEIDALSETVIKQGITVSDTYGPILVEKKHPVLYKFMDKEAENYQLILKQLEKANRKNEKYEDITRRLSDIQTIRGYV